MTGSFRSCGFMLLMILGADQSSFLTCGDTHTELDKAGDDALAGDKGSVELKGFADSVSICDVLRVKFPTRNLFTRHNKSTTNMSWID